jgi:hypothetical protein
MPKTRRTGSIRRRGENSWLISLSYDVDGKRKVHYKTIKGTKREAEQYLSRIVRERDTGTFVDAPSVTFNGYFDKWLESVSKLRTSERTSYGHESIYSRYFRHTFGYKKLDKLHVLDIQKVYGEMLARGLSPQTVRHAHAVLRCALKQAVKWNLIPRNPCELVELPKVQRKGAARTFV